MKAFFSAIVVALVMAYGASFILDGNQRTAEQAFATQGVRL